MTDIKPIFKEGLPVCSGRECPLGQGFKCLQFKTSDTKFYACDGNPCVPWYQEENKRLEKESRKLHRMIEEGITFEDLENDITFPG